MAKTDGTYLFAGDLHHPDQLWGVTLRSPHPAARIVSTDARRAWRTPGVRMIVTGRDLASLPPFGLDLPDQPILADREVRYVGEPVALVAADSLAAARDAAARVTVHYEERVPLTDPDEASAWDPIHPDGNVFRTITIRHGDPTARGPVVVEGSYVVGRQDQAFLAPEAALAVPKGHDRVELHVATQWAHGDQRQLAACLAPAEVEVVVAGVGGAFGAREDLSLHVHACLLALRCQRPVKMVYTRRESFLGHPHRHPARLWYRHSATADGRLVSVRARIVLDGGAYASSSRAVVANVATLATGPYRVPNAEVDALVVRTNNPPSGAMRGFGAVQVCFAHEAQMDLLAARLGLDPVDVRLRNALVPGDELITGQRLTAPAPVAEVVRRTASIPLPVDAPRPAGTVRAVGFAAGYKNLLYSAGYPDAATVTVSLSRSGVRVEAAAAEVGQGFVTVAEQIVTSILGIDELELAPPRSSQPSAGSSSASRQTWLTGGALQRACARLGERLVEVAAVRAGVPRQELELTSGTVQSPDGSVSIPWRDLVTTPMAETAECRAPRTEDLDADGQGDVHAAFAFVAHRAVVDVDPDLGTVRVVQVATAQDVGRVVNPLQVVGQVEGGTVQGLGLALTEDLRVEDGHPVNPSFGSYLLPTPEACPPIVTDFVEQPATASPLGAKGVGEPPIVSSGAAIVAAIRRATGLTLDRIPVRPHHLVSIRADDPASDGSRAAADTTTDTPRPVVRIDPPMVVSAGGAHRRSERP
jgi:xanthine dehydrogenase D subunit